MLCLANIIRDDDPSVQCLLRAMDDACSLTALVLAAWHLARVLAIHVVEAVLATRAREPTSGPPAPRAGHSLQSKGCAPRQLTSVLGRIRWPARRAVPARMPGPSCAPLTRRWRRNPGAAGHGTTPHPVAGRRGGNPPHGGTAGRRVGGAPSGPRGRWGDGPVSPRRGIPQGKTAWHEVKVGIVARLGRYRTRTGRGGAPPAAPLGGRVRGD